MSNLKTKIPMNCKFDVEVKLWRFKLCLASLARRSGDTRQRRARLLVYKTIQRVSVILSVSDKIFLDLKYRTLIIVRGNYKILEEVKKLRRSLYNLNLAYRYSSLLTCLITINYRFHRTFYRVFNSLHSYPNSLILSTLYS